MMDYTVSRSFPLINFLLHQAISFTSLDQFLSYTDNFMLVSFEEIVSQNAFEIMKLAYRDLKLRNVFFFMRIQFFCLSLNSLNKANARN